MSEREIYQRTATEAAERYRIDPRFRAIASSVAHEAMREYVERNPGADTREVARAIDNATVILMERLFKADAELLAQREMADRYRKLAEDALATSMPPIFIRKPAED